MAKDTVWEMRDQGGGGQEGGKIFCAGVRTNLLWRKIYCAKTRPNPRSQYGSKSCRGMARKFPRIMQEYDLATAITICPLNQPRTWDMGLSRFYAVSRIKLMSTMCSFFPKIPSTERTDREKYCHCSWQCFSCLSFFFLCHQSMRLSIGSFL